MTASTRFTNMHSTLMRLGLLLLTACANPSDVSGSGGALTGGTPDIGRDALDQQRRDAVVGLSQSGCMATMVTPRLLVTAWHCVGNRDLNRPVARFGQDFPATDEQNIPTAACVPYPRSRTDSTAPTCLNFPYRRLPSGGLGYTAEFREPFDLAVLLLSERVDAENRSDGPRARPMPIAFDSPGPAPDSWTGRA